MENQNSPDQFAKNGQQLYRSGKYLEAAEQFEKAAKAYAESGEIILSAEMANNQSVALLQAGDAQGALKACEGTEKIFHQAGDVEREGIAIANYAAALEGLNRLEEALEHYQRAAALFKQIQNSEMRAVVLKAISSLQIRTNRQLEALVSMDAALEEQKKLTLKERILKKLLDLPFKMIGKK